MPPDDLAARVRRIVSDSLGVYEAKVTDEAMFVEDLGADSLDMILIAQTCEEEFAGVHLPDVFADSITVGDFLEQLTAAVVAAEAPHA